RVAGGAGAGADAGGVAKPDLFSIDRDLSPSTAILPPDSISPDRQWLPPNDRVTRPSIAPLPADRRTPSRSSVDVTFLPIPGEVPRGRAAARRAARAAGTVESAPHHANGACARDIFLHPLGADPLCPIVALPSVHGTRTSARITLRRRAAL